MESTDLRIAEAPLRGPFIAYAQEQWQASNRRRRRFSGNATSVALLFIQSESRSDANRKVGPQLWQIE
jgi:hypothetical protein